MAEGERMRGSWGRLTIGATVCAAGLALSSGSAFGSAPLANAVPARHLTDGQSITVLWKNFNSPKVTTIAIVECTGKSIEGDPRHCDVAREIDVPGAKAGSAKFTVHTGTIGSRGETCGTSAADGNHCLVVVLGLNRRAKLIPGENAADRVLFG